MFGLSQPRAALLWHGGHIGIVVIETVVLLLAALSFVTFVGVAE